MTETGAEPDPVSDQRAVQILARERVFAGFLAVDRYTVIHERSDGRLSQPLVRLVVERGDAAAVLPYDPATKQVILVRQFRLPAFVRGNSGWLWEVIAGTCPAGSVPQEVARREALEEAGLHLGHLAPLLTIYPSPGASSERIWLYWADLRRAERVAPGGGEPESDEDLEVASFALEEALAMVRSGAIVDAKTIVALQCIALMGEAVP